MATWPANGETDWNTKMLAYLAVEHNTDGTHDIPVATIQAATAFSAITDEDSEANAMLKAHAYLAATDGFVYATVTATAQGNYLRGYVGDTDDPAGAGILLQDENVYASTWEMSISFSVATGEYFEVTTNSTNAVSIYWRSIGTLSKPVDQD